MIRKPQIIPIPQKITKLEGESFDLSQSMILFKGDCHNLRTPAIQLADEIEHVCGQRAGISFVTAPDYNHIVLEIQPGQPTEAYEIEVLPHTIKIKGNDVAGLYYGVQTLRQMIREYGVQIPSMRIMDEPTFSQRGFYHDATRGKVAKVETYMALAEKLAFYKINQLQLYIEHSFAFARHIDIWAGSDPITAEDILCLDEHCQKHHIDLVPSLSTFGHFYSILRSKRKGHLNELDIDASEKPFSFLDRQSHYTLNCQDPESLALVQELIAELAPLFSSKYFNICCDETFDLGKGKNQQYQDKLGSLYLAFLLKVMEIVRQHNKIPMYWGDVVLSHPELLNQIPKNAISLHWHYGPGVNTHKFKVFAEAQLPFYACPGVSGWNYWTNNTVNATQNITRMASAAREYGAIGLLNTDWGDFGHINLLANSYHGMILGAAVAWNIKEIEDSESYDFRFSSIEFGDQSHSLASMLHEISIATEVNWNKIVLWLDPSPEAQFTQENGAMRPKRCKISGQKLLKAYDTIMSIRLKIMQLARNAQPQDALAWREIICGAHGAALMHLIVLMNKKRNGDGIPSTFHTYYSVADSIRKFEQEFCILWHLRNKPSEYWRIRELLMQAAQRLDEFAQSTKKT